MNYQITGDVNDDLTNLQQLYQASGKVILTGNKDVDYEILNYLDAQDISVVCRSNKYAQQLCHNPTFWRNKFDAEELLVMYEPDTLIEWLTFYKIATQAKQYAIRTLIINDIEYFQNNRRSTIDIINNNSDTLDEIINYIFNVTVINIPFVSIVYDESSYTLNLSNGQMIDHLDREIITGLLNLTYQYSQDLSVESDDVGFIYFNNNDELSNQRKGMLSTILYYENLRL